MYMDEAVVALSRETPDAKLRDILHELEKAQEDLVQVDASKSKFIAVAAHELKTPLTLIEGYVNMLKSEFSEENYPRVALMLGGISNGTTRLRDIINDMIDVSMIDMDLLELHVQPLWLRRLLDIVVDELSDSSKTRSLVMAVVDFDDRDKPVMGDPERLHQVIRNVLINAIKYTPDGGAITIGASSTGDFVDISVTDTGIGIEEDDLERIFDKFSALGDVSLHSSSKTNFKGGGPGLGLAIARGIIEAHGGSIWAESPGYDEKSNPGATFHIVVPVRIDDAGEQAPDAAIQDLFDETREDL